MEVLAIELKVWRPCLQCHVFRLETRARELTVMASLSLNMAEAKGNQVLATKVRRSV